MNIRNIIVNIYIAIFILFTVITAFGGIIWQVIKMPYFSIFIFFIVVLLFVLFLFYYNHFEIKINYNKVIFFIIIIGIILRLGYFYLITPEQTSDFAVPIRFYFHILEKGEYLEYSNLKENLDSFQEYYSLYPSWGTYMLILNKIYQSFGYSKNIIIYLNIILFIITDIFFYYGVKLGFNKKIAFFSSCIFAFYPQLIMWSSIATPDHFTILIISLVIFIFSIYIKNRDYNKKKTCFILICLTFMVSLLNLFKPLSILFLLIYIFSEIINCCRFNKYKINLKYYILFVFSFFIISSFINNYSKNRIEKIVKTEVQQATPYYILWGYSVDKNGKWNPNIGGNIINDIKERSKTHKEELEKLKLVSKEIIRNNIKLLPEIWIQKTAYLFSSDNWAVDWTNTSLDLNKKNIVEKIAPYIKVILTIFNSFIMIIMSVSVLRKNKIINILSMSWLGYMMFLIVASIQTRYRCIFYLQQCILAVIGFTVLLELLKKLKKIWRKNERY